MRIGTRKARTVCIVNAAGRLVLGDGEKELRTRLSALLAEGERRFVFNLDGLTAIDSAGVGEIVACYQRAAESAAVMKIALGPEGQVRRVFELSGLDRAIEVFDEEQQAVASFS